MKRCLAVIALLLLALSQRIAAQTVISDISHSPEPVGTFHRLEIRFSLSRFYSNPYNPNEADVQVEFTSPSGVTRWVPAFFKNGYSRYLQDGNERYSRTYDDGWRARLTAEEAGTWQYRIHVTDTLGSSESPWYSFACYDSGRRGFVRVHPANPDLLAYDDGSTYNPIGYNICWGGNAGGFSVTEWQARMQVNGGNWGRYWLSHHTASQALEWIPESTWSGLGWYSQQICARIDDMLEDAHSRGIRIQLCLDSYNAWNYDLFPDWDSNPYNIAQGGMLTRPIDLFTNAQAKEYTRRRYRYVVARWGWCSSVLCWEFFNEVDIFGAGGPDAGKFINHVPEASAWHAEMGDYIRSIDPWEHLRTTSFSSSPDHFPEIVGLPQMDIVQVHQYSDQSPLSHARLVNAMRVHGRPVILGEWGTVSRRAEVGEKGDVLVPSAVLRSEVRTDPSGQTLHDAVWALAVIGSGAMSWWWDSWIAPNDFERMLRPVSTFMNGGDWGSLSMDIGTVHANVVSGHNVELYGSQGWSHAYLWVQDRNQGSVSGLVLDVVGMADDTKRVEFWDAYSGTVIQQANVPVNSGVIRLSFPAFTKDIAVKVIGDPSVPTPTMTPSPTPTPRGSNIVTNPGGEAGSLTGWTGWQQYPYYGTSGGSAGRAPLRLDPAVNAPAGGRTWEGDHAFGAEITAQNAKAGMYQQIDVTPGRTYTLSCYAAPRTDYGSIALGWLEGTPVWIPDAGLPAGASELERMGPATDWQQLSGTFMAFSWGITVYAQWTQDRAEGTNAFYVDAWELREVIAVTATPTMSRTPTPTVECQFHSMDYAPADWRISLSEFLRVVQLHNGAIAGAYHCDSQAEDGFGIGPGETGCTPHDTDYNPQDWQLSVEELMRAAELYGGEQGYYHCDPAAPDGFNPGPAP